jgi:hypothetical protein
VEPLDILQDYWQFVMAQKEDRHLALAQPQADLHSAN